MLFQDIDNEDGGGQTGKVGNGTEGLFQFGALTFDLELLSLGDALQEIFACHHTIDVAHFLDSLADGGEVGKHTAGPTFGHVRHTNGLYEFGHGVLRLFLGGDEQDLAARFRDLFGCCAGFVNFFNRLVEVDDVDAVLLHEDVLCHLGVPFSSQVPKVATSVQ